MTINKQLHEDKRLQRVLTVWRFILQPQILL